MWLLCMLTLAAIYGLALYQARRDERARAATRLREIITEQVSPAAGRRRIGFMAAVALAVSAPASAGEVTIVGPAAVPVAGYPCRLFVQGELPDGTVIGWDVSPRREGIRQIQPVKEVPGAADLATLPGEWRVSIAIHEPDREIYFRFIDVKVPGTPYVPPDGPKPTPTPTPTPTPPEPPSPPGPPSPGPGPTPEPAPENRFDLAAAVVRESAAVTSPNRVQEALCVAKGIGELIKQIDSGQLTGAQGIVVAIGATFDRCLSAAWDGPRERLTAFIAELYRGGKLKQSDDWKQLLREGQHGLQQVR